MEWMTMLKYTRALHNTLSKMASAYLATIEGEEDTQWAQKKKLMERWAHISPIGKPI